MRCDFLRVLWVFFLGEEHARSSERRWLGSWVLGLEHKEGRVRGPKEALCCAFANVACQPCHVDHFFCSQHRVLAWALSLMSENCLFSLSLVVPVPWKAPCFLLTCHHSLFALIATSIERVRSDGAWVSRDCGNLLSACVGF